MAFELYASVDDTTTQLNDGQPFRFESIEGMGSAGITRYEQSSPLQQGATDLGFRVEPRTLTLNLVFTASDDATLDSYRDTLLAAFKPLGDVSTFLTVRRDDGEIRKLVCHRVGSIDISLAPELRPGHTHRAVLRLRAASPLWQANDATIGSATFIAGTAWYLAGGSISLSDILRTAENPAVNTPYIFTGGDVSDNWSVAFVTTKDTATVGNSYVWYSAQNGYFRRSGTVYYPSAVSVGSAWPGTPARNLHVAEMRGGTAYWRYWDGAALQTQVSHAVGTATNALASNGYLRGDGVGNGWPDTISKLIMLKNVSVAQLNALAPYMLDRLPGSVDLANDGDIQAYPILRLKGPLADPVIVNQTVGGTIDLTGITIADGETWTIDLRDGRKRIYDAGGNNMLGSVPTLPIGMADFALAPAPIAPGGVNTIVMSPGSAGSVAAFQVEIINQYLSY